MSKSIEEQIAIIAKVTKGSTQNSRYSIADKLQACINHCEAFKLDDRGIDTISDRYSISERFVAKDVEYMNTFISRREIRLKDWV